MRFVVDECTGPAVARFLRELGHDVFSVFEQARGIDDNAVIDLALAENRILITNDKDVGEKAHRERRAHRGIVLLRLADERAAVKVECIRRLMVGHAELLSEHFVVVTERAIRVSGL